MIDLARVESFVAGFYGPCSNNQFKPLAWSIRFVKRVKPTKNGCWIWTAAENGLGYGVVGIGRPRHGATTLDGRRNRGRFYTHRLSYQIECGSIPDVLMVLHKCDNPRCLRPDHLFVGDQHDNMQDAARKRRTKPQKDPTWGRGERNTHAKLTHRQVLEIRRRLKTEPRRALAATFRVSYSTITHIAAGRTWR